MIAIIILIVVVILILASCIKIVPQANAYVVERLGAYQGTWEVGIHFKMPIIPYILWSGGGNHRLQRASC